jgi:hypothetical protein
VPRFTNAVMNAMLAAGVVPGTGYWMGLNSVDPVQTGTGEATGGGYARQAIIFGAAALGIELSTDAQSFTVPAEAGGLPFWSLWTALSGGTYLLGGTTTNLSTSIPAGSIVNFAVAATSIVQAS